MGEEADRLIQRLQDGGDNRRERRRDNAWSRLQAKPLEGPLTMAALTQPVLPAPPRVMPKEMQEQIAGMSESQRAVRILAFNEDISLTQALQKYNQYTGQLRKQEERQLAREKFEARFRDLDAATTVGDLKPLLSEIIQHLWG